MFLSAFGASKPLGAAPAPTDPLWDNVQFLQTFDGLTVGSIPNPVPNQKSGVATTGTNPTNWYVSSDQARSGRSIRSAPNSAGPLVSMPTITLPTALSGQFTFEWSFFRGGSDGFLAGQQLFGVLYNSSTGSYILLDPAFNPNGSALSFRMTNGTNTVYGGPVPTLSTWYDIAVCRNASNVVSYFINGALVLSFSSTVAFNQFWFPSMNTPGGYFDPGNLWVDDVRITNVARYAGNYTPSHPFPTQ